MTRAHQQHQQPHFQHNQADQRVYEYHPATAAAAAPVVTVVVHAPVPTQTGLLCARCLTVRILSSERNADGDGDSKQRQQPCGRHNEGEVAVVAGHERGKTACECRATAKCIHSENLSPTLAHANQLLFLVFLLTLKRHYRSCLTKRNM